MKTNLLRWGVLIALTVGLPLFALEQPGSPLRLVSIVPSQTELLFALGFGPHMVGATDYCNYPASATTLERCGAIELNLEKLVSLKPTHVIDVMSMHRRYQGALERLQIKYLDYPLSSIRDVPRMAASLAADLGQPEVGVAFGADWEREIARLKTLSGSLVPAPRVFVEVWNMPLQGAGPASFLGELLDMAGGKNILASAVADFPLVNPELVVTADPEVILLTYPAGTVSEVQNRPGWKEIHAVKNGRVFQVEYDAFVRPGPRLLQALRQMIELIRRTKE